MANEQVVTEVEVKIVYPSAHKPAERKFSPNTPLREIKQFALNAFTLNEGTVDANQIVFFLIHQQTKIENLDQPLSTFLSPHDHKLQFRLVKEIVAGAVAIDPVLACISLQADLDRIEDIRTAEGWILLPWPLKDTTFFVTMKSIIDGESYMLRMMWDGYPEKPPSVKPVNPDTKDMNDVRAWPLCDGFRLPPTADLCLNITRDGFALHPDWARDHRYRWESSGNPAQRVLFDLQDRLNDRSKYHGRAK